MIELSLMMPAVGCGMKSGTTDTGSFVRQVWLSCLCDCDMEELVQDSNSSSCKSIYLLWCADEPAGREVLAAWQGLIIADIVVCFPFDF